MCGYSCCYQVRFDRTKTSSALSNSAHIAQRFYGLYRAHKNIKIPKREKNIKTEPNFTIFVATFIHAKCGNLRFVERVLRRERNEMKKQQSRADSGARSSQAWKWFSLCCLLWSDRLYLFSLVVCRGSRENENQWTRRPKSWWGAHQTEEFTVKIRPVYNNNNAGDGEEERRMNWVKVGARE